MCHLIGQKPTVLLCRLTHTDITRRVMNSKEDAP